MAQLRGYARVSTDEQMTDPQLDELRAAGCTMIYTEHASGASRARPELARLLDEIAPGDTLVVVRLDRLARSVGHLIEVIDRLKARGAAFRSLHDPIDTSSPQGEFTFHILGAVAQLERSLIAERTRAGLRTARARGRRGGNPGLRAGDPAAVRKAAAARDEVYLKGLLASADDWLPTVRRLRPQLPWGDVARVLTGRNGATWTPERLRRSVRRLVSEGLAEADLLARTPVRPANDRLAVLVAGIVGANPSMSLRAIAAQLEGLHERAPRGGDRWSASSVQLVLDRARRQGLIEAEG